jgi:hypothetical protein
MDEVAEVERLYSRQWWESRTNDELQRLAWGGFATGETGAGAHRELERRARELRKAEEQRAALREVEKARLRMRILGIALLATMIGLLITQLVPATRL